MVLLLLLLVVVLSIVTTVATIVGVHFHAATSQLVRAIAGCRFQLRFIATYVHHGEANLRHTGLANDQPLLLLLSHPVTPPSNRSLKHSRADPEQLMRDTQPTASKLSHNNKKTPPTVNSAIPLIGMMLCECGLHDHI
uniref:Secreted peptide n=1 Tax=Anopheles braziliensis TaxID=58242 RepID=A0A2M3ZM18_9DIPT